MSTPSGAPEDPMPSMDEVPEGMYPRWLPHAECEPIRFTMEGFLKGVEAIRNEPYQPPRIILSLRQEMIRRRKVSEGKDPYIAALEAQYE